MLNLICRSLNKIIKGSSKKRLENKCIRIKRIEQYYAQEQLSQQKQQLQDCGLQMKSQDCGLQLKSQDCRLQLKSQDCGLSVKSQNKCQILKYPDSIVINQTIAQKYTPIQILGEGSFGIVMKVKRLQDNKLLALKSCKDPRKNKKLGIPPLILKELAAFKKLKNSEHVITLIDFIKIENELGINYHFVLELAHMNLYQYIMIQNYSQIRYQSKLKLIYQLIHGVGELHQANILHRDLKPSNILLKTTQHNNYVLKIGDLGSVAFQFNQRQQFSCQIGTLWYKPPQILFQIQNYNQSYDLWSLGVIIVQILLGRVLFRGFCYIDQIFSIFETLGDIKSNNCYTFYKQAISDKNDIIDHLPKWKKGLNYQNLQNQIRYTLRESNLTTQILSIITDLLNIDPRQRVPVSILKSKYKFLQNKPV